MPIDYSIPALAYARDFGRKAHDSIKQVRKYTGEPYWTHTEAVAEMVAEVMPDNYTAIIAAIQHDTVEDTPVTHSNIFAEFGPEIHFIVDALTHQFTTEKFPKWNRAKRKKEEAKRLGDFGSGTFQVGGNWVNFAFEIHTIKLADLIDNTVSIVEHDPKFAETYLKEKEFLLRHLTQGHRLLQERAWASLNAGLAALEVLKAK
jgi:(p)ppGpp synthase/HD superfamily hydrolase